MSIPEITTVTFDLWQTLLLDNRELGQARTLLRLEGAIEALARFGEDYGLDQVQEAYRACYRQCRKVREDGLDVSFREQVEIFINGISAGLVWRLDPQTLDDIVRAYDEPFLSHPPLPHSQAITVLEGLKTMGLRMGLISNTGMTPGSTFRTYLEQQGMLRYFDTLTFSDEVGVSKPSDEIFLMTLRALDVEPAQTVHVGDHVKNDVVGANRLGMKTVWITGFYEREDPTDAASQPDAAVDDLGLVVEAVAQLSGR